MKDQYFGDFGDYQKMSLLKILQESKLKVTVHWMKTRDDGSTDGKHTTYLNKPDIWKSFDTDVFDFIKDKIKSKKRLLSHIEKSIYCLGINFINTNIEDEIIRNQVLNDLIKKPSDIIFIDPDNGIEVPSTNRSNLYKYITLREISEIYNSGKTVIVYQHFSRSSRETLIRKKTEDINNKIRATVVSVQVKHSVYFLIIQKRDEKIINEVIKLFSSKWKHLAIVR